MLADVARCYRRGSADAQPRQRRPVTFVYGRWLHVSNATTVSMTFLVVVLVTAATSRLWVAIVTSLVAVLAFNFFFLPPIGTLTIADPHNWVALFAFLAVSLVASNYRRWRGRALRRRWAAVTNWRDCSI